jgi:LysM repeat protein
MCYHRLNQLQEENPMLLKKYVLVSVILLLALASCTMQYPQSQAATPQPTNPFTNPIPTGNEPMAQVEGFATGTSIALTMGAGGSINTPTPTNTPIGGATAIPTNTPIGGATAIPTNTPIGGATAIPTNTSIGGATAIPVTGRPATYTLQNGEHPYCIARRFNVDPTQLLQLSGLSDGVIYPAGTLLHIPQTGSFPGDRALRLHPTTYTVTSSDETFYSIACLFGDVDPARIAQANMIALGSQLKVGQTLNIP